MSLPLPPVLVVDDERNMRLSLQDMLSADKYPVRTVESAEDAMALLERESFLLVITDVRLGGMNGMEFMRRALQRWPGLPFLMITAHATPRLAVEAIKAGATEYLPKPFAPEELLHNVALCADRYRLVQENAALHAALAKRGPIVPVYIFDEAGEGAWPAGGVTRWLLHHLLAAFKVKDCSGSGQARKRWSVE